MVFFTGYYCNSKLSFLRNNIIPEPVVGGPVSIRLTIRHNLKADEYHEVLDGTITFTPEVHDLLMPKKVMETF